MTTQVGKLNGEVSRIKGEVKKYKEEASSLSNELYNDQCYLEKSVDVQC